MNSGVVNYEILELLKNKDVRESIKQKKIVYHRDSLNKIIKDNISLRVINDNESNVLLIPKECVFIFYLDTNYIEENSSWGNNNPMFDAGKISFELVYDEEHPSPLSSQVALITGTRIRQVIQKLDTNNKIIAVARDVPVGSTDRIYLPRNKINLQMPTASSWTHSNPEEALLLPNSLKKMEIILQYYRFTL